MFNMLTFMAFNIVSCLANEKNGIDKTLYIHAALNNDANSFSFMSPNLLIQILEKTQFK